MTTDPSNCLWHQTCGEVVQAPALEGDVDADLVVIGGGYTGLSAALHAAIDGLNVRLIEADAFGAGGSGRNVGLVNAGLWLPPKEIAAKIGQDAGLHLSAALASAPDLVFRLIDKFNIACEPVRNGTLHCAHAPSGMGDLETRHKQLSDLGAPVRILARDEAVNRVGSPQVHGALFDPRAGTIQPLGFAKGLARAAIESGAHLHEHSPATGLRKSGKDWIVTTPNGRITARQMIIATNAYALPVEGFVTPKIIPVHFFQAATPPLTPDQLDGLLRGGEGCWDTALVMSSWRLDRAGRLIIGGMGQLGHPGAFAHTGWLTRKLNRMFPALNGLPLGQAWHGRIAMTEEYLPKTLMLDETAMVTFGYSGRGIGPGTLFGQRMVQALTSGDLSVMPRAPVAQHNIRLPGLRRAYYEVGATLTHLVKDRVQTRS